MLIRIVRMTFRPDKVSQFLSIFDSSKNKIRSFPGCMVLELHRDHNAKNIFITYSIWENEKALNSYRQSELFRSVWPETKILFLEKPFAFSNVIIEKISIA